MNIQDLFGQFPFDTFVAEHLHRLPLALPNVCKDLSAHGTWAHVGSLLASPDADVMVARQGARYDGEAPKDLDSAQSLAESGCTILVRHAERHDPTIAALAKLFSDAFRCPVNVHVYATPPGCFGFSWHYDAEDVFIIQTAGEKEYLLRKNTVNPWPLEETIPADMRYEREVMPMTRVLLRGGDLLYIPCGYWHRAQTADASTIAISFAVGIMSPSAIDIFDLLRNELLQSLIWRQRLPVVNASSAAGERNSAYEHVLNQLAVDISRTLTSRKFFTRVMEAIAGVPQPIEG